MATEINGLRKAFGSFEALRSVSLSVQRGEFIAILGPSGCGKTTLLRLIAGFDQPTDGEIVINGTQVSAKTNVIPPEQRNIGMVFQSFALWPHLNVQEQVEFPLRHHPYTPKEMKKQYKDRAEEVLKLVGLDHLAKRMPNELSGGQKQRVALARALAHQPALLLMDEPLSSLDAELREDMRKEIQSLHRLTRSSIIYVTHDQGEALAMADRIVIMKNGQIEQVATPEEIFLYPETSYVASFVGKATMIEGTWEGAFFRPNAAPTMSWEGEAVAPAFKQHQQYPVRPDEWVINQDQRGIEATIHHVLYQGREIHYTVQIENAIINVISPIVDRYAIGENVYLHKQKRITHPKAHIG
ncbi:ABC transporter ATP-binding protein [Shouchella patagoniensis]|uniref:ABC transporter ATP-binding protein n=1 Tax=Shouchella patagoniensis TaxID=228576 RepID=UPI00099492D5|nr:ABC transporter ATP-binding protein [Shouchella patagoniensis]